MSRGFYVPVLFLLSALLLLTGCVPDLLPFMLREEEEGEIVRPEQRVEEERVEEPAEEPEEELPEGMLFLQVYYGEEKGGYLIPFTVAVPWTEGVARAALEKVIRGPTPAQEMRYGLTSYVPPTTEILGLNIRDGLARIDLSREFFNYDPEQEKLVLNSIVFTLLQFSNVEEVEILVGGAPPEAFPGGTVVNVFGRERGINLEVEEGVVNDFTRGQEITLYFCSVLGESRVFYVPVTRVVEKEGDELQITLEELLEGPREGRGLFSDIPPATELRNLALQGETVIVDFSGAILEYRGGLSGEENIKNQLLLTLTELHGVEKVGILVEGERKTLEYGTSFQEPLPRPAALNRLD